MRLASVSLDLKILLATAYKFMIEEQVGGMHVIGKDELHPLRLDAKSTFIPVPAPAR